MNEVKTPKKPLLYYSCIALLILLLLNFLALPLLSQSQQNQIQEVDYGTFMTMAENMEIGQVQVSENENQILFTNKDNTIVYRTGMMPDLNLTQMLRDSGCPVF